MSDLISRSALIRTIKCRKDVHKVEYAHDKRASDFIRCCECSEIERLVNNAPTVEAKPIIKSKWYTSLDKQKTICTNCHTYFDETNAVYWRYCPECGAEMEW